MVSYAAFSALLSIMAISPVQGQPRPPQTPQEPLKSPAAEVVALNTCMRSVRSALPTAEIGAHFTIDGKLRTTGSPEAILALRECMRQENYPLPSDPN